ncbi:hypothetical protein C8R43DRAFT_967295 [Mycena crocata]|nr:hypothetical protein C8R43DRAFT_967295 [Mycena crocata]
MSLDGTIGLWLIGLFLESILFGAGLLQTHLYFLWYPKDGWITKATVWTIVVLETLQTTIFFAGCYFSLVTHFGDFATLAVPSWHIPVQCLFLYMTGFVAQAYYARCIYLFYDKDKILPIIIFIFACLSLAAGAVEVSLIVQIGFGSPFDRGHQAAAYTQAVLTLITDLLVTVGLCWRMHVSRSDIQMQSTNNLINFLIITAVNRGALTMITAAMCLILNIVVPTTFAFHLTLVLISKFYMNSLLAMLNTRNHALVISGNNEDVSLGSLNFGPKSLNTATTNTTSGRGTNVVSGLGTNIISMTHESKQDEDRSQKIGL